MNHKTKRNCAVALGILLIVFMLPMYSIARYSYLAADDFSFLEKTLTTWRQTGKVGAVVKAAFQGTKDMYLNWTGPFVNVFFSYLQPASFGEQYYWLSPVIMMTVFTVSFLYFLYVVLRDYMQADKVGFWLVGLALTFLAVQYCYEPVEAFYWHTGAVCYAFFYAVGLLCLGLLLRGLKRETRKQRLAHCIPAILLAAIVGGSNYSTALVASTFLALLAIYLFWHGERKEAAWVCAVFVPMFITMMMSVTAPGNAARLGDGEISVVQGIFVSFIYGAYSMANATTVPVLIVWLTLCPVLYRMAKASAHRFQHPIWSLLFLFGLYSALGTPCFSSIGFAIPGRNINLIYFSYYLVVLVALYYVLGWWAKKDKHALLDQLMEQMDKHYGKVFLCACLLFAVACVGGMTAGGDETGTLKIGNMPAGMSAAYSLASGEAQEFHAQMLERKEICEANPGEDVVLDALRASPELLAYADIKSDPAYWVNTAMARFYGNASVRLDE